MSFIDWLRNMVNVQSNRTTATDLPEAPSSLETYNENRWHPSNVAHVGPNSADIPPEVFAEIRRRAKAGSREQRRRGIYEVTAPTQAQGDMPIYPGGPVLRTGDLKTYRYDKWKPFIDEGLPVFRNRPAWMTALSAYLQMSTPEGRQQASERVASKERAAARMLQEGGMQDNAAYRLATLESGDYGNQVARENAILQDQARRDQAAALSSYRDRDLTIKENNQRSLAAYRKRPMGGSGKPNASNDPFYDMNYSDLNFELATNKRELAAKEAAIADLEDQAGDMYFNTVKFDYNGQPVKVASREEASQWLPRLRQDTRSLRADVRRIAQRKRSYFQGGNQAPPTSGSGSGNSGNADRWRDAAAEAARKAGIPQHSDIILKMIQQESGGDPGARSQAGAAGLMQLMENGGFAELKRLGLIPQDKEFSNLTPQEQIDYGALYFKLMLDQNNGDVSLALASYNAGPGAVRKHGGIPEFQETQDYVDSILGQVRQIPKIETLPSELTPAEWSQMGPKTRAFYEELLKMERAGYNPMDQRNAAKAYRKAMARGG